MFESKQFLRIIVINNEKNVPSTFTEEVPDTDVLGWVDCQLGQIIGARKSTLKKDLSGPSADKQYGQIEIVSEDLADGVRPDDALVRRARAQRGETAAPSGASDRNPTGHE